jgi:hypothetical protein
MMVKGFGYEQKLSKITQTTSISNEPKINTRIETFQFKNNPQTHHTKPTRATIFIKNSKTSSIFIIQGAPAAVSFSPHSRSHSDSSRKRDFHSCSRPLYCHATRHSLPAFPCRSTFFPHQSLFVRERESLRV